MLAGILAGAMGGGAQAVGEMADSQLAQQSKVEMAKLEQQLAIERAEAIARRQQAINREDNTYNTVGQGGEEKRRGKALDAGVEADAEVERRKKVDPLDVKKASDTQLARDEAERAGVKAKGGDKEYLRARQADTDAGVSSSTKASQGESARGARIANDEAEALVRLRKRAEEMRARGDEVGAQKVEAEIARRKGGKAEEYDTEKVTEITKDDATGAEIRRERTERRRAAPGGAKIPNESMAHEEARRAVATGKIDLAEANRRLRAAGLNELPASK